MTKWPLLLAGALCLGGLSSTFAQTTNPAPSTAPAPPPSILDNDEMTHLTSVREQVLAGNPDLKAEEEKLKALHDAAQTQKPSEEQRKADYIEWKAYQKKMRAAMLKVDPTLQPLFDKLDAARKHAPPLPSHRPSNFAVATDSLLGGTGSVGNKPASVVAAARWAAGSLIVAISR